MATVNSKLMVYSLRYVSGQTDRHTGTLIAILRTPTKSEVTTLI